LRTQQINLTNSEHLDD